MIDDMCSSRKYPYPPPPSPAEANRNFEGRGFQKEAISDLWWVASRVFFPGALSKINEQAISYFTVNRYFKAKIIVFIDDLLFVVG